MSFRDRIQAAMSYLFDSETFHGSAILLASKSISCKPRARIHNGHIVQYVDRGDRWRRKMNLARLQYGGFWF